MTTTYNQTDASAAFNTGCSGQGSGVTVVGRIAQEGGVFGSTEIDGDPDNSSIAAVFSFDCQPEPQIAVWGSGVWEVQVDVRTHDGGNSIEEIHVCDFDGTTFASVAALTGIGFAQASILTASVVQGADYTVQSESLSRPFVVVVIQNTDSHGQSQEGINPGRTIIAPFDASAAVVSAPIITYIGM